MKTQICTLINGMKNVIREECSEKYINAPKATSHNGFAGTGSEKRNEIAEKVFAENGELMNVVIFGKELTLRRRGSLSGKTNWYSCDVDEEFAKQFVNTDGNFRCYNVTLYGDCTVCVNKFVKRTEGSQWKHSLQQYIDESFVEIL